MKTDRFREFDSRISRWFTPVTKWILYLAVGGFVLSLLAGPRFAGFLAASWATTVRGLALWQILTFPFATVGLLSLIFNLLTIWMFGARIEMRWGSKRLLRMILTGAGATLLVHLLVTGVLMGGAYQVVPIFGLTPVAFAILGAYAYYWPDDVIHLYGVVPIKVKWWVMILGLLMFASLPYPGSQVGRLTHFTGLAAGLLYVWVPRVLSRRGHKRGKVKQGSRFKNL